MKVREATEADWDAIWPIFSTIVKAGDTYGFDTNTNKASGFNIWLTLPVKTYVIEENNDVLGSYYIKQNMGGAGSHVCNCGYMVSPAARGKGLATKMCEHSQVMAHKLGFKAMQFNFVASTNTVAINLWHKLGFTTSGKLIKAFNHPIEGYVDALVMYKWLDD